MARFSSLPRIMLLILLAAVSEHVAAQASGCEGCVNSRSIRAGWIGGWTSDFQLRGDTSDWHSTTDPDVWYFSPDDYKFTPSLGVGLSKGKDGEKGDVEINLGVSTDTANNSVYRVSNYRLVTQKGDCRGTYPACEAHTGCHTELSVRVQVVGTFLAGEWSYMWDDLGRHDLAPKPGADNKILTATQDTNCDDDSHEVLIRYKAKSWIFTYDFLRYWFRCGYCPGV